MDVEFTGRYGKTYEYYKVQHRDNMATSSSSVQVAAASSAGLLQRLSFDGLAGAGTALAVAPLTACFDEAITRSASGENLWLALADRLRDIITRPTEFFGSAAFQWMWIVYACTYVTANGLKSLETIKGIRLGFLATIMVTVVNMTCGIAKDSAYAKMFGAGASAGGGGVNNTEKQIKTPISAFLVWFLRDLLAFTFILSLPTVVSAHPNIDEGLAKFLTPILAQYLTTPLHLLGFNIVNMPDDSMLKRLIASCTTNYSTTVAARQMRIVPPYSIGGLINGSLLALGPTANAK